MFRSCCPRSLLLHQYVQTWTSPLLLGAGSTLALASAFSVFTALRLLIDNMRLPFSTSTYLLGATRFIDALWAVAMSPLIDRLPLLTLCLWASVLGFGLRVLLVASLFAFPHDMLDWLVLPLLLLITSADSVTGRTIDLQLKRTADSTQTLAASGETELATRLFGLMYSLSNIAVFIGTGLFDVARTYSPTLATANAVVQVLGAAAAALTALMVYSTNEFAQRGLYREGGSDSVGGEQIAASESTASSIAWKVEVKELLRDRTLWRFTAFSLCLSGARAVMVHMETTLTEVMTRMYGPEVHFAAVQAINPLLVFALAPLAQYWSTAYNGYWVITLGAAISALSVLPLALFPPADDTAAGLHAFIAYGPYVLFMVVFSIGEAIWSARLSSYSLSVAPRNRRASYLALASIPLIGVRLVTAWHSGWMVDHFCAAAGAAQCAARTLWLWIFLLSASSPLALLLFRRWLDPNRRYQRQKEILRT
jgi:hypothetical protein